MRNQKTEISAIYPDLDSARRAAHALGAQGVDRSRIILVDGGEQFEEPIKVKYRKRHIKEFAQVSDDGLAKGAAIGSFGGFIIGLGIITLPAIAPVVAVTGMASSIGTCAALGGLTGGLFESLAEITVPEGAYQNAVEMGHVLLVARVDKASREEWERILDEYGALTPRECLA
jgi:hypothetical protein